MRPLWALALTAALPFAAASGTLDTPAGSILLDNGHAEDCIESETGLCPISATGDTVGDVDIDTEQQFHFIGVAFDGERINDALTFELLPDATFIIDASDLQLPNPVFGLLVTQVGSRNAPGPVSDFGVIFTREAYGVSWFGPQVGTFPPDLGRHGFAPGYAEGGGIQYDRIGPPDKAQNTTTDDARWGVMAAPCEATDNMECYERVNATSDDLAASTPNVRAGLHIDEAGLGSRQDAFTPTEPLGPRSSPAGLGPRASLSSPPGRLPQVPFQPGGLESGGDGRADPAARWVPRRSPDEGGPPLQMAAAGSVARSPDLPPALILGAVSAGFAFAWALSAFYTRITRREAPLMERRARILALLTERGPMPIRALAQALGVDRTTVKHHVGLLQRLSHVSLRPVGGQTVVALPGQDPTEALGSPRPASQALLLEVLRENGGELGRNALGQLAATLPPRTRNHALRALLIAGRIERVWKPSGEVVRLTT